MTDHATELSANGATELQRESHAPYLKVWMGLLVLTVVEYFYAKIFMDSFGTLVAGLLFWAAIKAGMVGWYFMHLKFEKPWVCYMLIPACIFAILLTMALVPDMAMKPDELEDKPAEGLSLSVPYLRENARVHGYSQAVGARLSSVFDPGALS